MVLVKDEEEVKGTRILPYGGHRGRRPAREFQTESVKKIRISHVEEALFCKGDEQKFCPLDSKLRAPNS